MNEEIKSILKMIESGKITAEEGEKLISSLDMNKQNVQSSTSSSKKFIRIEVLTTEDEETKVKVNIPLSLAKTVLQMKSIKNQIKMNAGDIDLDFDEIITLIENNAEGDLVNVESESNKVHIWIE